MAIQSFTSGQTLTAAQMSTLQANDYNWSTNAQTASYVLVASDVGKVVTMTNAGATTITVNTSLFAAGDRVKIINLGAGACTITAGTATVNSASSLALTQYQAGTLWFSSASAAIFIPDDKTVGAGLTLISATTIGSAVSTVTVSNAFSATYDNYKITITGGTTTAEMQLNMTLGSSSASYYSAGNYVDFTTGSAGTSTVNNGSAWQRVGYGTTSGTLVANIDIMGPNLAQVTYATALYSRNGNNMGTVTHLHNVTTAYTSFTITTSTGTVTGGIIRVYGYQNS